MFESLKLFVKGWAHQGRSVGVPPVLARPYLEIAAAFLEQKIPFDLAMKAVATNVADVRPFVLTYTTMPFVIGGVWADYSLGKETKEFFAVLDALKDIAEINHAKAPDIVVEEAFILDADRETLFHHFRTHGSTKSKHELMKSLVPRKLVAGYMVEMRSGVLSTRVPECLIAGSWTDASVTEFATIAKGAERVGF